MDGSKFDEMARALGRGTSRRRVVKGLAGGIAGIFAGGVVARQAAEAGPAAKVTICHWSPDLGSYEQISVAPSAVPAHKAHNNGADIIDPDFTSTTTCGNCNTTCTYENSYCASGSCACDPTSFEDACAGICDDVASDGCGGTYTCPTCQPCNGDCCFGATTVEGNNVTVDPICGVGCGSLPGRGCTSSAECDGGYCTNDPLGCSGTFCFAGCTACPGISSKSALPSRP